MPTAFSAPRGLALSAMSELMRLGYQIPDDISVVGFFDYALAKQVSPQLTTVRVEGVEWARRHCACSPTASTATSYPVRAGAARPDRLHAHRAQLGRPSGPGQNTQAFERETLRPALQRGLKGPAHSTGGVPCVWKELHLS